MSKILLLGDVHAGARNASPIVCEYQLRYFEEELFPLLKKEGITTILQLGDWWDSRKFSNHFILGMWKKRVFDILESLGIKLITIVGNHDLPSRNTTDNNISSLFLHSYSNVTVIDKPTTISLGDDVTFLLLPWICDANEAEIKNSIENSTSLFCAGHLELNGFDMQKGVEAHGHQDPKDFEKFDQVYTGHYHTKSVNNNIMYTGTPYQLTWADYGDQKMTHIFDTKTRKVTPVYTKTKLFRQFEYNDKGMDPVKVESVSGIYIKVVVVNKTDPYKFEKWINNINLQNPADLRIMELESNFDDVNIDMNNIKIEDTRTMLSKFVGQVETDLDKGVLKDLIQTLYIHALEVTN